MVPDNDRRATASPQAPPGVQSAGPSGSLGPSGPSGPSGSSDAGAPPTALLAVLRRIVDVRPPELAGALWAFFYFFFLLASYYLLRPLRDEMAIAGGVNRLQWLFTATLGVMLVAVPVWSALAARLAPGRLIAFVYRFFLVNLLLFYFLFQQAPGSHVALARGFFVWTSVFNLFVVSVFWSFMADVFRQEQGKRLFGFVAAGGSAGAIAGPLLASSVVREIGPTNLLLIAALLLEAASQCAGRLAAWSAREGAAGRVDAPATDVGAGAPDTTVGGGAAASGVDATGPTTGVGGGPWAAVRLLFTSPYLGAIAIYVLLMTIIATFGYMLQARLISGEGLSSAARTALFARIDLMVNVASAFAQAVVAGRLMARFGVGPALLSSPLLAIGSGLALAAYPRLGVLIAGTVTRRVAEYAVASPARQVLFTVVTREEKYKPKALIDTVVFRGGDAIGSWAFALIARQGVSIPTLALSAIPLAVVWVAMAAWLARRHERGWVH